MIAVQDATALLEQAHRALAERRVEQSLQAFFNAETAGADSNECAGGRWQCWMLLGDMERAWRESDAIRASGKPDPHRVWNGSSWTGKRVLLRTLHGFGDAIQCIRYAPLLREQARSLVVETNPRLLDLMRCFPGVDEVRPWNASAQAGPDLTPDSPPAWDVELEITELPYVFRTETATIPRCCPYLQPPSGLTLAVANNMGAHSRPRIGLAWGCGVWNRSRMIPLPLLTPLLGRKGAIFYSLERESENAQWTALRSRYRLEDAAAYGDGLLPLAAVIASLDLVITVDTMAAHMAGAMGKPAWLLLQHAADWRWMLDRTDSPWYPSMRIFRQRIARDWHSVIDAVGQELDRVCESSR
jgi:hypothetical protein